MDVGDVEISSARAERLETIHSPASANRSVFEYHLITKQIEGAEQPHPPKSHIWIICQNLCVKLPMQPTEIPWHPLDILSHPLNNIPQLKLL